MARTGGLRIPSGQRKTGKGGEASLLLQRTSRELNFSGRMAFIQHRLSIDATSRRCADIGATFYKRHVPAENELN